MVAARRRRLVKVALSQVLIDVALGESPKRVVNSALAKAAGRPLRFKMVSRWRGFTPSRLLHRDQPMEAVTEPDARSRAMSDPVVKQMQEKFGAEIRTVIDLKERS